MINLLLPEDKKDLSAEYHHRVLTVTAALISIWILIVLIISGSLYWYIFLERNEAEQALAKMNDNSVLVEIGKQAELIKNLNTRAKTWMTGKTLNQPSTLIKHLLDSRGMVTVREINYSVKPDKSIAITLNGKSPTRQQFLAYLALLETDPLFKKVDSPVKNLIQEKNFPFTLQITL